MYLKRASAYGTIAAKRLSRRGGMSFFSPLAGQPKKMTYCIMTAQRHDTIAAKRLSYRGGMSFFSPLAGQPKKMTHCAMSHGTIAAAAKAARGRERTAGEGWL